jgi:hypothetical protein
VSTYDCGGHYVILPQSGISGRIDMSNLTGTKVGRDFTYSSESNSDWMTKETLRIWLAENSDESGNIPLK